MAITPSSSNKESSSSTNSIVMETFQKVSSDTTFFHQRVLNNQKNIQPNHTSINQNIISNVGPTNKHRSNAKGINVRKEVDNGLPMGNHHFSLQSLLEALPAASVDNTNISEDQITKHQNRDSEKAIKRSSLSSLSTNGSRASGDFDGFFYI